VRSVLWLDALGDGTPPVHRTLLHLIRGHDLVRPHEDFSRMVHNSRKHANISFLLVDAAQEIFSTEKTHQA